MRINTLFSLVIFTTLTASSMAQGSAFSVATPRARTIGLAAPRAIVQAPVTLASSLACLLALPPTYSQGTTSLLDIPDQDATYSINTLNGFSWKVRKGSTTVGSQSSPNGWNVAENPGQFQLSIQVPFSAPVGSDYFLEYVPSYDQMDEFEGEGYDYPYSGAPYTSTSSFQVAYGYNVATTSARPGWFREFQPSDSPGGGTGASAATEVNLATGARFEYPGPDITSRHGSGPDATFQRIYSSSLAAANAGSPGLGAGWTDNFWHRIQILSSTLVRYSTPDGATEDFTYNPTTSTFASQSSDSPNKLVGQGTPGSWSSFELYGTQPGRMIFGTASTNFRLLSRLDNLIAINPTATTGKTYVIRDATGAPTVISRNAAGTDPLLTFSYTSGKLTQVTDSTVAARAVKFSHHGDGTLASVSRVQDPSLATKVRWSYVYESVGSPVNQGPWKLLKNVSAPTGKFSQPDGSLGQSGSVYDPNTGRLTGFTDARGNTRSYTYGSGSTAVLIKNSNLTTALAFTKLIGVNGLEIGTVNARGLATTVAYADASKPRLGKTYTDRDGRVSEVQTDSFGNPTYHRDEDGVITRVTYQYVPGYAPNGRVKTMQVFDKTDTNRKPPTTYVYYGENGETTNLGQLKEVWEAIPGSTTLNNDNLVQLTRKYQYTAMGNISVVSTLDPQSTVNNVFVDTVFTYTNANNPVEKLGQPLRVASPSFLPYNSTTTPVQIASNYTYDARGRVLTRRNSDGGADTTYVFQGDELVEIIHPQIGTTGPQTRTRYSYKSGLPTSIEDTVGASSPGTTERHRTIERDSEGNVISAAEVTGASSANVGGLTLDALDRPVVNTADGSSLEFNDISVPSKFTHGDGLSSTLDSSAAGTDLEGNVLRVFNGRAQLVQNTRYSDATLASVLSSTPQYPISHSFTYDNFGRVATAGSSEGTVTITYDVLDNPLTVDYNYAASGGPTSYTVTYGYYPSGHRQTMTLPFNFGAFGSTRSFTYFYNAAGLMRSLRVPWTTAGIIATPDSESAAYGYDGEGALRRVTCRFGQTTYSYTSRGWLRQVSNVVTDSNFGTGSSQYSVSDAQWYADGRIKKYVATYNDFSASNPHRNLNHEAVLGYDTRDFSLDSVQYFVTSTSTPHAQLSTFSTPKDSQGNLIVADNGTTMGHDAGQKINNSGYGYDSDGNETSRLYPGTATPVTREFDAIGQLRKVINTNAGPTATLTMGYLATGDRAWKDSGSGTPEAKRWFIYDGDAVIAEIYKNTSAGNRFDVYAAYAHGPSGIIEFWRKNQNRPTSMFYDLFGNPTSRLQYTSSGTANKTNSVYAPTGRLLGDYSVASAQGYSWANDPVGPQFQHGFLSDEETRQYNPNSGNLKQTSKLAQLFAGGRVWDSLQQRYIGREDRFANTYVDASDGSWMSENYEQVLLGFELVSYVPVVGASVDVCEGIYAAQSGNAGTAAMHFGAAALSAVTGGGPTKGAKLAAKASGEALSAGAKVSKYADNGDLIQGIANRVWKKYGSGAAKITGAEGSHLHTRSKKLLERYQKIYGDRGLEAEISFLKGGSTRYGEKYSSRFDVYDGTNQVVYDYKFGESGFSKRWLQKARRNLGHVHHRFVPVRPNK